MLATREKNIQELIQTILNNTTKKFLQNLCDSFFGTNFLDAICISLIIEEMVTYIYSNVGYMSSSMMQDTNCIEFFQQLLEDKEVDFIYGLYCGGRHFSVYCYEKNTNKLDFFDPLYDKIEGKCRLEVVLQYFEIFKIKPHHNYLFGLQDENPPVHCGVYALDFVDRRLNNKEAPLRGSEIKIDPKLLRCNYQKQFSEIIKNKYNITLKLTVERPTHKALYTKEALQINESEESEELFSIKDPKLSKNQPQKEQTVEVPKKISISKENPKKRREEEEIENKIENNKRSKTTIQNKIKTTQKETKKKPKIIINKKNTNKPNEKKVFKELVFNLDEDDNMVDEVFDDDMVDEEK